MNNDEKKYDFFEKNDIFEKMTCIADGYKPLKLWKRSY